MDQSPYLGWKLNDYDEGDLNMLLGGASLRSAPYPAPSGRLMTEISALSRNSRTTPARRRLFSGKPEIGIREALIDETTFRRWFPEMPSGFTDQQKADFRELHDRRVGFRVTQLRIARLPLKLFEQYCLKQDAGKPREQTELYKNYLADYSPAELESTGFWKRFDQKFEELGGCEGLPYVTVSNDSKALAKYSAPSKQAPMVSTRGAVLRP